MPTQLLGMLGGLFGGGGGNSGSSQTLATPISNTFAPVYFKSNGNGNANYPDASGLSGTSGPAVSVWVWVVGGVVAVLALALVFKKGKK